MIFSPKKEIIYKEVFPQRLTTALCTLPSEPSGYESLLIGVDNKIWSYDINPHYPRLLLFIMPIFLLKKRQGTIFFI